MGLPGIDGGTAQAGSRPGPRRRDILALGSIALAAPWLAPVARAQAALFDGAEAALSQGPETALPLSIGYLEGSDGLARIDRLTWEAILESGISRRVVPAAEMLVGDQELAGGSVRVTVHGFYPALPALRRLEKAALVVWYPPFVPELVAPLPFYAWEYRRKPGRNVGQRLSFVVPLEQDGGLELAFHAVGLPRGAAAASVAGVERRAMRARFTVDWTAGRPRLQRGVYLLGVDPGTWSTSGLLRGPRAKPDLNRLSLLVSVDPVAE
jgi:hypothetical protein